MTKSNDLNPKVEVNIEDAQKLLAEAQKARVDACAAEIEKVLAKHQCTIMPRVIIHGERIIAQVTFVPNQPT